jgi:hypothetical protein
MLWFQSSIDRQDWLFAFQEPFPLEKAAPLSLPSVDLSLFDMSSRRAYIDETRVRARFKRYQPEVMSTSLLRWRQRMSCRTRLPAPLMVRCSLTSTACRHQPGCPSKHRQPELRSLHGQFTGQRRRVLPESRYGKSLRRLTGNRRFVRGVERDISRGVS